jgi:hypothetical protein
MICRPWTHHCTRTAWRQYAGIGGAGNRELLHLQDTATSRGPAGELQKRQVEDFLFAFDSNLAPIVGQQATLTQDNGAAAGGRIDLLIDRARARECDLVVKSGGVHGERGEKGYLYDAASALFRGDRSSDAPLTDAALRQRAQQKDGELTYTCTPPGSGVRIGIDRDENGILDGDEEDPGSAEP